MLKKSLLVIAASLVLNFAQAALPTYSQYVYFGDSLSDMGNFVQNNPLPCVDLSAPVTNSIANGGTNAGNTWANITTQGFVATPSKSGGNDWAWSGAETGNQLYTDTGPQLSPTQGLQNQVAQYLARVGHANPGALYVIWAGSNDILDLVFAEGKSPVTVISSGTSNIGAAMATLANAGAKNFLVIGVPDISLTPIATNPNVNSSMRIGILHSFSSQLSTVCNDWDDLLFSRSGPLAAVKKQFPLVTIYTYDVRPLIASVTSNPTAYGFPTTIGGLPNNEVAYCSSSTSDNNPDDYIFYNFIHPTSKAHTIIAESIRAGAQAF